MLPERKKKEEIHMIQKRVKERGSDNGQREGRERKQNEGRRGR